MQRSWVDANDRRGRMPLREDLEDRRRWLRATDLGDADGVLR
jgi:hypothetical protein